MGPDGEARPATGGGTRTATFLMTDIEGSSRLWQDHPSAMADALRAHDAMLRDAVESSDGAIVKTMGDGLLAVFDAPAQAVDAAIDAQIALDNHRWPATGPLRVRMGIHTGTVETRDADFYGPTLNRLARLMAIAHGGQVLLSAAAVALLDDRLPPDAELVDRGEHQLRDLARPEHVFQLVGAGVPRDLRALRSVQPTVRTNLPTALTSFIGRERERAEIERLIALHRLVTLVGVGGTGKTRLMLEVGHQVAARHADGVWLVELAPISDPDIVVQEIARALAIPDLPGQPVLTSVTDFLREKSLLLLLDNCEHLIDAAAEAAQRLLGACRSLHILATSREALGVPGEAVVQVPSLGLPPRTDDPLGPSPAELDEAASAAIAESDAVRLFVDRALAAAPDLALDPPTLAAVADVCRRLDGIPLAIELAAARCSLLSVPEIAAGLGDRFRLLTGGRRTSVPRQQTLQALIDWSWDLLTDTDQRLLRRLSVFAGSWRLDEAVAVTADPGTPPGIAKVDVLDGLGRLADRSLIVVDRSGGSSRYRMLETIRQYARDRLLASGEAAALRDRHLATFHELTAIAAHHLVRPEIVEWLDRLDAEVENLRSALDWASETDPVVAVTMLVNLREYWRHRSIGTEGSERFRHAANAVDAWPEEQRAANRSTVILVKASAAAMGSTTGRYLEESRAWADEALRLARHHGDPAALSLALLGWSLIHLFTGDAGRDAFRDAMAENLALAESIGAWDTVGYVSAGLVLSYISHDPATTDALIEKATAAADRAQSLDAQGFVAVTRGRIHGYRRDTEGARYWFEKGMAIERTLHDRRLELVARSDLAHALRRGGAIGEARVEYDRTVREWYRLGHRGAIANQLESLAFLARAEGDTHRPPILLGAAERLRELAGDPMLPHERVEYDDEIAALHAALDDATFTRLWAEGRAMPADQAVNLARGESAPAVAT